MPRVTAQYVHGDGSPRSGRIRFAPSTTVVGEERIILPAPLSVDLDAHGALAVDLVGTDDPDYSPAGWVWTVTETPRGGRPSWSFALTEDIDLSEVSPVVPPDDYVTLVPTSRAITAGPGLTGGGTLAADRTLAVGAGAGIVVEADAVAVDLDVIATVEALADETEARVSADEALAEGLADETTARESADGALGQSLSDEADARVAGDGAASDALAAHAGDTTGVHGIADTAALVLAADPRLSDARTPTAHTHPAAQISDSTTVGRAVVTAADAAAARSAISAAQAGAAPATHAASHAAAGSDPVTIAQSQVTNLTADLNAKAPLASPALTGNPTAPTQSAGNNSTRLATTAYVDTAAGLLVPKALFDANSILKADTDNTPSVLAVGASTLVGRGASGGISALTPTDIRSGFDLARLSTVGNLLTANQASGAGGYQAISGCSQQAVGVQSEWLMSGTGSATFGTLAGAVGVPVTAGQTYTASAKVKSLIGTRAPQVRIYWYNEGTFLSATSGTNLASPDWTVHSVTGVAPANATKAAVIFNSNVGSSGDVLAVDDWGFWAGAGGEWAMPGTPITNLGTLVTHPNVDDVLVQRWDSGLGRWQTTWADTGTRSLTLANSWTATSAILRRTSAGVQLVLVGLNGASATSGTVLTLDAAFRPTYAQVFTIGTTAAGLPAHVVTINTNGTVVVGGTYTNVTAGGGIYSFGTLAAWPTSLQGTLVTSAPG